VKPVYPVAAGRRNHINVVMQREGHGAHDIYSHVNLLAHLGTTADPWTDGDGDGRPEGHKLLGVRSGSEAFIEEYNTGLDLFRFHPKENSTGFVRRRVTFPIVGISVELSCYIRPNTYGSAGLRLKAKLFDDSVTKNISKEVSAEGKKSLAVDLTGDTYIVHPSIYEQTISDQTVNGSDRGGVGNPALRVDGSDQYVSY